MKNGQLDFQRIVPAIAVSMLGMLCCGNTLAATIDSTGGTLAGVSPGTVGSGSVTFNASHSTIITDLNPFTNQTFQENFTDTTVSGSIGPDAISVNAQAQSAITGAKPGLQAAGSVTGSIGFTVAQSTSAAFTWSDLVASFEPHDSLTIKAADGSIVLGCVGRDFAVTGGCELGKLPNINFGSTDILLTQGAFNLGPGSYSLLFSDSSGILMGNVDDAAFQFGLNVTPVPLPAALPLLLGGLAAFGFSARRSSRANS